MALILIRKLGTRKNKNGILQSWGEYLCFTLGCCKIVEKRLGDDRKNKSCGCLKSDLISKGNKGKIRTEKYKLRLSKIFKEKWEQKEFFDLMMLSRKNSDYGWNRGLTKEIDERVRNQSVSLKNGGKVTGVNNFWYGKTGDLSPFWAGGKSFEEYGIKFNRTLKKQIKNRDFHICQTPNCMNIENLCVHHIDYNKKNNNPENLITLCSSCHSKTNGKNNRQYWTDYYSEIVSVYL